MCVSKYTKRYQDKQTHTYSKQINVLSKTLIFSWPVNIQCHQGRVVKMCNHHWNLRFLILPTPAVLDKNIA